MCGRSVRVSVHASAEFPREVEHGTQHATGHFITQPQIVSGAHQFDFDQLVKELDVAVDNFNSRRSNFVLDLVGGFVLVITQYRPLCGSTYIPTPPRIAKKRAVINVVHHDERCSEWSLYSCLYPSVNNPTRVSSYKKYQNSLNIDGIDFPVQTKDIHKFEKQNPDISVSVISLDDDDENSYLSSERHRKHHVNLLLFDDPGRMTSHYVYMHNFSLWANELYGPKALCVIVA